MGLNNQTRVRAVWVVAAVAGIGLVGLAGIAPTLAQNAPAPAAAGAAAPDMASIARGLTIFKTTAQCVFCHNWDGTGARTEPMEDLGRTFDKPSFVNTQLDPGGIEEAARCGRPGTIMPRHDRTSWSADHKCYGLTKEELATTPLQFPLDPVGPGSRYLQDQEIKDVVNWIIYAYKNGGMNKEKCVMYYGATNRNCDSLK